MSSGKPTASACATSKSLRTACIATRSNAWFTVVSKPTTSTSGSCRRTCSVHAESLPEDQARRALAAKGDPYPRTSRTAASPRAHRLTLSTVVSAIARNAGSVKYAWCPVITTFGNVSSRAKTSSAMISLE